MKAFLLFLPILFAFSSTKTYCQSKIIYSDQTFRIEPVPKVKANNLDAKWGLFFWEFGDGHYKVSKSPEVEYSGYSTNKRQDIHVQLIPFYTKVGEPLNLKRTLSVKKGKAGSNYNFDGKLANIESSTNREVIPGHEARVAVHYKAPPSTAVDEGFIAFFYNNISEKSDQFNISYDPFKMIGEPTFHYNEVSSDLFEYDLKGDELAAYRALKNAHNGRLLVSTDKLKPGEDRRFFLSISSDKNLTTRTGDAEKKLSFTALWMPGTVPHDPDKHIVKYEMTLLRVHDPNKIDVDPEIAYFRKHKPQTFNYHVKFQNEEKGVSRNAEISVYLGKGLDKSSLFVHSFGAINKSLKWSRSCTEAQKSYAKCFEIDTGSHPDSVKFTFHNIDLPGPKFFNRKRSKGYVKFSIKDNGKKVWKTKTRVGISLDSSEQVITNWAKVKWREKGLFLTGGVNFNLDAGEFSSAPDGITDRMAIGLHYQNAPIGQGLSWGCGLAYQAFRIERFFEDPVIPDPTRDVIPEGGTLRQSENIKLRLTEAQLHVGYQTAGLFKIYASSGITVPFDSKFQLGAEVQGHLDPSPEIIAKLNSAFGILGKSADPEFFNRTYKTRTFLGYVGSLGIEVGSLNTIALGLRSEFRYFGKFYYSEHECYKMKNLEAYLRFKLFTL